MMDDFTQCFVFNSRMAARAVTRRYDRYLRAHGLTATQLSLLGTLRSAEPSTISELAESCGFERTTLKRNLDRLEAFGLVALRPAKKGNGRIPEITGRCEARIEELVPLWRQAQAELRDTLSPDGFDTTLGALKRLARI